MSRGKFLITPELLCDILHLPTGTEIHGASMVDSRYIELIVSHPQIVPSAEEVEPLLNPMWSRHEPLQFDGWGQ